MPKGTITRSQLKDRVIFHDDSQIMEVSFADLNLATSVDVNTFYDHIEDEIAKTGESQWFFLVNYCNASIEQSAWLAFSRRGKELNLAHSMGSVRFDASEETRKQIERDADTEAFDPNLFYDRESAWERLVSLPSKRREKIVHKPSFSKARIAATVEFWDDEQIMYVDFTDMSFEHSLDVNDVYDFIEEKIGETDQKWYFLVNYENTRIQSPAWVQYAARGKRLNQRYSLGSVRYAPGSETEADIRLRAESQDFRPNIRNTREEALQVIDDMKAAGD